jgi:putative pyruvate formate lyase activating enzyme
MASEKDPQPSYLNLSYALLAERRQKAFDLLEHCRLCPRQCGINRLAGQRGICRTTERAKLASFNPHFGEEQVLVGQRGSGTIFLAYCNLGCNFCQNYDISHLGYGQTVSSEQLAEVMLYLQQQGCHNINFVTPTHVLPQILAGLEIAISRGLSIPLIYNTSAYDQVESLRLLEGLVDIYMPDFKFWEPSVAEFTCQAPDYPEVARAALIEMHRQVGNLKSHRTGLAYRGLLVRHLVMPSQLAGTEKIMQFIAHEISVDTYINLMFQYHPCGEARESPELNCYPDVEDFNAAIRSARQAGLYRFDKA